MLRNSVVLPTPFGPSRHKDSPPFTEKERFSKTGLFLYPHVTWFSSNVFMSTPSSALPRRRAHGATSRCAGRAAPRCASHDAARLLPPR